MLPSRISFFKMFFRIFLGLQHLCLTTGRLASRVKITTTTTEWIGSERSEEEARAEERPQQQLKTKRAYIGKW